MSTMIVRMTIIAVLMLANAAAAQVQQNKPSQAGSSKPHPQLFVKERVMDLGKMKQGDKGRAKFLLENKGEAPVRIINVRASCACTLVRRLTAEDKLLEPNETLELEAVFDTKGRVGKQRKTVTVTSNDPIEPRLQLVITAEVVALMEVLVDGRWQRSISLRKVNAGDEIAAKIEVLPSEPGKTLEITSVNIQTDKLSYKVEPLSKDDRTGRLLKLSVVPDAIPGPISAQMRINARIGDEVTHFTTRVTGEVVGELTYSPRQIKQTSPLTIGSRLAPVKVGSETQTPFEILGVHAGPNLDVQITEVGSKHEYLIVLQIRESATPGPFGTFLDIRTTSVGQPVIRIPVFAYVRPHVEAYPPIVFLRQEGGGKSAARTVKIETAKRGPLEFSGITVDSPYVTAAETDVPGRKATGVKHVRIASAGTAPRGTHETVVRIQTNVEAQPEVTIPVTLVVP